MYLQFMANMKVNKMRVCYLTIYNMTIVNYFHVMQTLNLQDGVPDNELSVRVQVHQKPARRRLLV